MIAASLNTPLELLSSFLTWWAGELSALARYRSASPRAWQILFLRNNAGCEVFVRSRNGAIEQAGDPAMQARELVTRLERRLGKRSVSATQVVLRLQPHEVVQKQISVPAAALAW